MRQRLLMTGLVLMLGCGPVPPPQHTVVVYDASNSGLELVAKPETIRTAFDGWVQEAIYQPGASFAVLVVGKSRDSAREVFRRAIPPTWGPGVNQAKVRFLQHNRQALNQVDLTGGGSAIAEAIHRAAARLHEQMGTYRLQIVSDMRQVTLGVWNFERSVPQPEVFLQWLERERLLADLTGVEVEINGLHSQRGPDAPEFTAAMEEQLRGLWQEVFERLGAEKVIMRSGI